MRPADDVLGHKSLTVNISILESLGSRHYGCLFALRDIYKTNWEKDKSILPFS